METKLQFEFADMAAHLLRNPLYVIQTSIRCLQTLDLNAQEQQALLDKMWNQSQRLTDFSNELLKILRLESEGALVCIKPVDLLPVVERVIEFIKDEEPDMVFHFHTGDEAPMVTADATKTEMILLNLLISATRRCNAGSNISVSVETNASEVIITVNDDGKPIPVEPMDDIFQAFYPVGKTALNIPSTYQLGFHSTKQLVEMQNGRIWAESQAGRGSRFSFSLPIWEGV